MVFSGLRDVQKSIRENKTDEMNESGRSCIILDGPQDLVDGLR